MFVFTRRFGRILYCCVIMDPVQTSYFSELYLKNSLLDWKLKSMDMTEWFQNRGFSEKFSEITRAMQKIKIRTFSAHDLRWENVIFWGCADLSYHANKHIDNLSKKISTYTNLLYSGLKYHVKEMFKILLMYPGEF